MERSSWIPLGEAAEAARCGEKAATLARLLDAGLPVVEGRVLTVDDAARAAADPSWRRSCAQSLLAMSSARRWILRSSSPQEDRPGRSAAGWFASPVAAANVDELDAALAEMLAAASDPLLGERLGENPRLAVLAQPHLDLDLWCTAEFRAGRLFYEGWTGDGERFEATTHDRLDDLVARAVQEGGVDPALLELGIDPDGPWVLQLRPAPSRAPARRTAASAAPVTYPGLGVRVHDGDAERNFVPDLEHCPTPLSVLLATAFGRWIAADPDHTPSRLVDGRWHDPATPARDVDRATAEAGFHRWRLQLAERVEPALRRMTAVAAGLQVDPGSWRRFLDAWFTLQRAYFAMPTSAARAWARAQIPPDRAVGLAHTPGAERARRWRQLRERLFAVDDPPDASADAIARWLETHGDHPLAGEVETTARTDRRIAPLPYDGFTPGLDEDPWPLYRALALGIAAPVTTPPPEDPLAGAILALAETDNELLLEAYAVWRSAVRRIATLRGRAPAELHFLDVASLEGWLARGPFPKAALRQGRALHARWQRAPSTGAGDGPLQGIPAAGGTAQGPAARAASLLAIRRTGTVAVVDTLGPADALAVAHFSAIVCATGDRLGHASVLCREYGIPCVVGIADARGRLARARTLFVDGDAGLVRVLEEDPTAGLPGGSEPA